MRPVARRLYLAHEFATRAGVTVRALHHYDRLGLLTPASRSESGYRLYSDRDLARLEQIVVLKFLGLPLKKIGDLLADESSLAEVLRAQRDVLAEKRRGLDRAILAVVEAERALGDREEPKWDALTRVIKEITMQQEDTSWTEQYYDDETKAKVEARKAIWSPELQERVTREWNALYDDVRAVMHEDPASPKAQAVAGRWWALVSEFTGGDRKILEGLNTMYADRDNWPAGKAEAFGIPKDMDAMMAFVRKAWAVAPKPEGS